MKLFPDCHAKCILCALAYTKSCFAGIGDNDFTPATDEQLKNQLKERKEMIESVKDKYERYEIESYTKQIQDELDRRGVEYV